MELEKQQFIPIYQSIVDFSETSVSSCAEDGSYFEPFFPLVAHFTRLMEAYQSAGEEDNNA